MMYRINFLTVWVGLNIMYALIVEDYAVDKKKLTINDGSWGFLEVFAAYLAILVLYRVFFGGMHILNFKLKGCLKKYRVQKVDLHEEFRKLKKADNWDDSVVDNNDFALLEKAGMTNDDNQLIDDSVAIGRKSRVKG